MMPTLAALASSIIFLAQSAALEIELKTTDRTSVYGRYAGALEPALAKVELRQIAESAWAQFCTRPEGCGPPEQYLIEIDITETYCAGHISRSGSGQANGFGDTFECAGGKVRFVPNLYEPDWPPF